MNRHWYNPPIRNFAVIIIAVILFAGCAKEKPVPAERWVVGDLGTRAGFRDVFFLDAQTGWIVGGSHNIEGGIIGSTTDGGLTWNFKSGIVRSAGKPGGLFLNAVWFLNQHTGLIVGDRFHILRTMDGGEHWHKPTAGNLAWAHLRDLHFVDDEYGWAIGNGGLARTTDGGASWRTPLPIDAAEAKPVRGQAIHFVDRNRGWLVGKFGLIRATTNGGRSWTQVGDPEALGNPNLWGLDFSDDLHGWAVGEDGVIVHTADGGQTWQHQVGGVPDLLMDVDFIDTLQGWAVGFNRSTGSSTVLWTVDGGANWTVQAKVRSEGLRALFVLDGEHAWAVGEQQRRSAEDGSQKLLRYEVDPPAP